MVKIQGKKESEKAMDRLVSSTRYRHKGKVKKDKNGVPVVKPEPDDPDD